MLLFHIQQIKVVPEGWAVIVTAQPSGTTLILNPIAPSKDVCYHRDIISHDKARGEEG